MVADSSSKAMGSLLDLLIDFVDSSRLDDSNRDIAHHLLQNYSRLKDMSLRQLSEMCFVSQASFSRFCRFLGFDSFADFKEAVDGANYHLEDDYSREFLGVLAQDKVAAFAAYHAAMAQIASSVLSEDNLRAMDQVMEAIDGAERTVLFSHHFPWHVGRYYQGKMMQVGRYVELYQSYEHQLRAADSLGENDVAIVCSVNGSYFSRYNDIMRSMLASGAKVVAITQSRHAMYINRADIVLRCGDSNENDVGKYALLMTLDCMVMSYVQRILQGTEERK